MRDFLQKKLQMGHLLDGFLDKNMDVVNATPRMKTFHDDLKVVLPEIDTYSQIDGVSLRGISIDKQKQKELLKETLLMHSRKLALFAHVIRNSKLEHEVSHTLSDFTNCTDDYYINSGRIILEKLKKYQQELQEFDVKQEDVETLSALTEQYAVVSLLPKQSRAERRENARRMEKAFTRLDEALVGLDMAASILQLVNSVFYKSYRDVRRIGANHRASVNIAGKINEALTGIPVENVKIILMSENGSEPVHEAFVRNHNRFRIKNLESGNYLLKASKPGLKDTEIRVTIISNEKTSVEVCMEKE